ncbi:MAG: hypothetical protein IJH75_08910 [Mogibacterium sp.]|nr:hypothetical protein [Mogibacterium sp.]
MNSDFHYYATYCAAYIAGYSHEESLQIAYSAQFTDCCSRTLLRKIGGPGAAATTQLQLELMDLNSDPVTQQDITRIWASFHFLPGDLHAKKDHCSKRYLQKYRLICEPNSDLLISTVELAKGRSLQAAGLAMHVLADTWAHRHFAGTPSLAINNTNYYFYEIVRGPDGSEEREIHFNHNPYSADDPDTGKYTNSLYQGEENSVMNLGHGRAGHLPDYSFARYRYLPAWADYREVIKDNPSDYLHAFTQMICALKYLRGDLATFDKEQYDVEAINPWREQIGEILTRRQLDASEDWKQFGETLSGQRIEDFDLEKYQQEYRSADKDAKDATFLGQFILAALAQKSMVTGRIFRSGNLLAGLSYDYDTHGFRGIRDFRRLIKAYREVQSDD